MRDDDEEEGATRIIDSERLRAATGGDALREELRVMETGERDVRLHRMRDDSAIDTGAYVAANKQQRVRFKHPRFEHLPDRDGLYELLGALDEGGMGEVRIARDPYLDRKVAMKLLKIDKITNPLNVERFLREAQITAKLDHPNIIPIYGLHAESDGRASFAMKLVQGGTLKSIMADVRAAYDAGNDPGHWTLRRRLEVALRMCDAMSYAHDMGVIHRDLKPANIMVGEYREVYVMDWGLAKTTGEPEEEANVTAMWAAQRREESTPDESVRTQHGAMIGTPLYMSPEAAMGDHRVVGPQSDVYALGAILFELVSLRRLIGATEMRDVIVRVIQGAHEPVLPYCDAYRIDPALVAIVERSTALAPAARYATMQELGDDLRRYLDDEEVAAHPDTGTRAAQRWMAHHRGLTFGLLLALVVVAAGAWIYALLQQNHATLQHQHRERQISNLQSTVSARAHAVDSQFLRFQLLVNRLAVATEQLLSDGAIQEGPLYTAAAFDRGDGPPDLKPSSLYRKDISLAAPVFKLAPGTGLEPLEPTLRRLLPLRAHFESLFLDSRVAPVAVANTDELWRAIAEDGVPGRWAFVGLEAGVHIAYPGKGGYGADYDPRKRPWYLRGRGQTRPVWGDPYVDRQGQGLVLPCVVAVKANDVTGVAGFEVALDFLQKQFMKPEGDVEETFVLDSTGRVLVTSKGSSYELDVDDIKDLPQFGNPRVLERVRAATPGVIVDSDPSPAAVFVVAPLATLNWFFVAKAPLSAVLGADAD